jgi:hypothetical protein
MKTNPPAWYTDWVSQYLGCFGGPETLMDAMLGIWWQAFSASGYAQQDFELAMPRIVMAGQTPNWNREHLDLVKQKLNEVRTERFKIERPRTSNDFGSPCQFCVWSGAVIVPLPLDLRDGVWVPPYRTGAVCCTRCNTGMRIYDAVCAYKAEKASRKQSNCDPPLKLDDYELRFCENWKEQMDKRDHAERLLIKADKVTPTDKKGKATRNIGPKPT